MFPPEMLKVRITSMAKELHSYFYHLWTFVIIYAVLGVKFLLFYVHHYLILMFIFFFILSKIFIFFHPGIFHLNFNSPLLFFFLVSMYLLRIFKVLKCVLNN